MPRTSATSSSCVSALRDSQRLAELERLRIIDTPPEADYDAIATLSAAVLRSPVAAVNFVDGDRHFTKAIVGMPGAVGGSVPNEISFCAATVMRPDGILVVPDTGDEPRWRDHPLVSGGPRVGFYAGASIVSHGERVGVVCAYGTEARPISQQERAALVTLADQVAAHLKLRVQNSGLRELAVTDSLTGLPNRLLLLDRLVVALAAGPRSRSHVGVLYCDVDEFKSVNDLHGHGVGDQVLCHVACSLRSATRTGDTVARISGDEFVVVCPNLSDDDDLQAVVDRITAAVGEPSEIRDLSSPPTVSIGAVLARPGEDSLQVLERADTAMYRDKARRGQRVVAA